MYAYFTIHKSPSLLRLTARTDAKTLLSQQQAAALLGYTQDSWDNKLGNETQPVSASKNWTELTDTEKSATLVLGYTKETWFQFSVLKVSWSWTSLTVPTGGYTIYFTLFLDVKHIFVQASLKYS